MFQRLNSKPDFILVLRLGVALILTSSVAGGAFPLLKAAEAKRVFKAGAFAENISPREYPVLINGGFLQAKTDRLMDPLHARCLVLDDGRTRIAIAVVDSCMLPRELIDRAKELARQRTGIPTDRMLVSATHTHSAPSSMGCLGCPTDTNYVRDLPDRIAEGITHAATHLVPARIGWAVTNDYEHTHTRRWIYRPDKMLTDPFGDRTVRANMHPGYQNPDVIGPSGPSDPGLSLLAVQSLDGKPITLLANYSMHYFGASPASADYYGLFAEKMKQLIGATNTEPPFVGIMSQGTSGDQMWMDYGQAQKNPGLDAYAEAVARLAFGAYQIIQYRDWAPVAMAESKIGLRRRTPGSQRLNWAREIIAKMGDVQVPRNQQEVYAHEAIYLHEDPVRELKLQAVRIGDLGITAIPNEVFAITGLKLKALSPLQPTFNIELANGSEGYIPPPAQHELGGYTTWPARTAALEEMAEPKIVEATLRLLERVSDKPRRKVVEAKGGYVSTVLASKPMAYWRLGEFEGPTAADATRHRRAAIYQRGTAFCLDGPVSPGFCDELSVNRCAQLAGGFLQADLPRIRNRYTIEMWFWNGIPADAREHTGLLFARGHNNGERDLGDKLWIGGTNALKAASGRGQLIFTSFGPDRMRKCLSSSSLPIKTWHYVALVRNGDVVNVYLNGNSEPVITCESTAQYGAQDAFTFGGGSALFPTLEGKLDEIAVYDRALGAREIAGHYRAAASRD